MATTPMCGSNHKGAPCDGCIFDKIRVEGCEFYIAEEYRDVTMDVVRCTCAHVIPKGASDCGRTLFTCKIFGGTEG